MSNSNTKLPSHTVERTISGRTISFESGKVARQAGGSVIVRCGECAILVTACLGEDKNVDFFPLTIDYVEKTYAAGKIPGGFFKREGKLSEKEILVSRLIDRPCRPLFPENFKREVQVIATVMSADEENDTDVLAVCGASAALTLSDMPFEGPIAGVRVARINKKLIINPTISELTNCDLNFIVVGTKDAIVMVEGGASEVPEAEVQEAIFFAHKELQVLIEAQIELQSKCGKPKMEVKAIAAATPLEKEISSFMLPLVDKAVRVKEKLVRRDAMRLALSEAAAKFIKEGDVSAETTKKLIGKVLEDLLYSQVRDRILNDGVRIDGRDTKTVRPINVEVGILPRTHGSALFTRGETQAIVVSTLGTEQEAQRIENLIGEPTKNFMLHYNFPPFSVGETKPMRGPGRREIGHGALAERAVRAVMPDAKKFPYVVRIVSEITESNGSSSMASVCGASLSLMDAGVPIKAPVAGVAMGLVTDGKRTAILTDILGDEDHLGDMDFKVCGTEKGITALQMDIKIKGLSQATLSEALQQAREGRIHILGEMAKVISNANSEFSKYAPRIVTVKINKDKIREVIGSGGKVIRSIMESCDVKVDVADDGTVSVSGNDPAKIKAAMAIIDSITKEAKPGEIYTGVVKRIVDFGAFVEIFPGTDGLVHISQLSHNRVNRVTDVVQEGDQVQVIVLDVDHSGKVRLSMKELQDNPNQEGSNQR